MNHSTEKSTGKLKQFLRNAQLKLLPFPFCYGRGYVKKYHYQMHYFHWLMKTQWYSQEKITQFQNERLKLIINHAYENVPYYRKIFHDKKLKPEDIQKKDDLKFLPILTKNIIRANYKELLAKNVSDFKAEEHATSGSTGEPLHYYNDFNLSQLINAAIWRHWTWAGLKRGEKIAVFRGSLINDFGKKEIKLIKRNNFEYRFSTFQMNKDVMGEYVQQWNKLKLKLIRGYPTSIEIFARFIIENSMIIHPPKAIQTSSEMVSEYQRELFEQAFKAPLFNWYGHGENTIAAGECANHCGLHLNQELGIYELIKTPETKNMKDIYNIISTSLWNFSMPFIRYDTEDLVKIGDKTQCNCGRGLFLIEELIGRKADILEGVNGVQVSVSSFIHYWKHRIDDKIRGIKYYQAIQEKKDVLKIRLVGINSKENETIIKNQLQLLLGPLNIYFEYLKEIPPDQKWRTTISKLKQEKD